MTIDDLRISHRDVRRSVLTSMAKMANYEMLKRRRPREWAVRLLFGNIGDIYSRLECEQALAKFWKN